MKCTMIKRQDTHMAHVKSIELDNLYEERP